MRIKRIEILSVSIFYESALYAILLLLTFARALGDGFKYAQYAVICFGGFLTVAFLTNSLKQIKVSSLLVFVPIIGFALINRLFVGSVSTTEIVTLGIVAFGIGHYLLYTNRLNAKIAMCLYVFTAFALVLINHSNSDSYYLYEGLVSRNYISIYLGMWLFVVTIAYSKQKKRTPLIAYIIYLIASVLSVGRMGILCSGLLLFLLIFDRYVRPSIHITKGFILRCVIFGLIVVTVSVFVFKECYWLIEQLFSRFVDPDNAGSNIERHKMLIQYFDVMFSGIKPFVLGLQTNSISLEFLQHDGNPHNSYLTIHSRTGIVSLSLILFSMMYTIWGLFKNGRKDLAFVSLTIIIRGLTDQFMIGDIGDILIGFCLLYFADQSLRLNNHE